MWMPLLYGIALLSETVGMGLNYLSYLSRFIVVLRPTSGVLSRCPHPAGRDPALLWALECMLGRVPDI